MSEPSTRHTARRVATLFLAALATLAASATTLLLPTTTAHACDDFEVRIATAILGVDSLEELHAPGGPLDQAWANAGYDGRAPAVTGIRHELTVAGFDEHSVPGWYGYTARVATTVAAWGTPQPTQATAYYPPDGSSCEGGIAADLVGKIWWPVLGDGEWAPYSFDHLDVDVVTTHLTKLFGEPQQFEREPDTEQRLSTKAKNETDEHFRDALPVWHELDPVSGVIVQVGSQPQATTERRDTVAVDTALDAANEADEPETSGTNARDGTRSTIALIGLVAVAAVGAGLAWKQQRRR